MKLQERLTSTAHWLLRVSIVSVFLYHVVLKFMNLQGFADMLPISYAEVVLMLIMLYIVITGNKGIGLVGSRQAGSA
ncbi:MAG: hypothetical protein ABFS24_16540 [Pseudomonadota bacterium]